MRKAKRKYKRRTKLQYIDRKIAAEFVIKQRMKEHNIHENTMSRDDLMVAVGILMCLNPKLVDKEARRLFY